MGEEAGGLCPLRGLRDVGTQEDSQEGMVALERVLVGTVHGVGRMGRGQPSKRTAGAWLEMGCGNCPTLGGPEAQLIGFPLGAEAV